MYKLLFVKWCFLNVTYTLVVKFYRSSKHIQLMVVNILAVEIDCIHRPFGAGIPNEKPIQVYTWHASKSYAREMAKNSEGTYSGGSKTSGISRCSCRYLDRPS